MMKDPSAPRHLQNKYLPDLDYEIKRFLFSFFFIKLQVPLICSEDSGGVNTHEQTLVSQLCFLPGLDQDMYIFIIGRPSVQFKVW